MKLPLWLFIAFIITLSTLCPTACSPSGERRSLEMAEAVIEHDLDSALSILNSIDTAAITSDGDRALHAMLLTMALDKCHLNPTDDSLIAPAIDYFARKGERRREMLATYYGGRVLYLRGDNSNAIVRFFKAREIAIELGEHFWHGMAARGIADIFNKSYNFAEELKYTREEFKYTTLSGRQPYINYSILDLATSLYNHGDSIEAVNLARQAIDSAIIYNDSFLKKEAMEIIGLHYITSNQASKALETFTEICESGKAEPIDSIYLSLAMSISNDLQGAIDLNKRISKTDDIATSSIMYDLQVSLGNKEEAFRMLNELYSFHIEDFKKKVRNNFSNAAADYFKSKHDISRMKLTKNRIILCLSLFICLLSIVIVWVIARNNISKKNIEIEGKIMFAQRLQEQIGSLENFRDQLQKNLNRASSESSLTRAELEEKNIIIKKLVSSKYDLIKELGQITYENSDSKQMKRRIADKVTSIIDGFSIDDTTIASLENELDVIYNNLISDLRQQCPSLKEEDFRLYIFSVLGFSAPVISLFLKEEKLQSVYNRKRRLKAKFKELPPEQYERFISHLE